MTVSSLYFLSEYSDTELLTSLADTRLPNAVLYPWQARMLCQHPKLELYDLSYLKVRLTPCCYVSSTACNVQVVITGGSILGPTTSRELQERLPNLRVIR